MLRRHHGRNQFAPRTHSGHGFEGDEPDRQSHRADGRDADLPSIAQLDHIGSRLLLDGVLPLRRSAGAPVAEDRATGGGRRTGEEGRRRVVAQLKLKKFPIVEILMSRTKETRSRYWKLVYIGVNICRPHNSKYVAMCRVTAMRIIAI